MVGMATAREHHGGVRQSARRVSRHGPSAACRDAAAFRTRKQSRAGQGTDSFRGPASATSPPRRTLAGQYGGAGIVLWQAEAIAEATSARGLYELGDIVRRLVGRNDEQSSDHCS